VLRPHGSECHTGTVWRRSDQVSLGQPARRTCTHGLIRSHAQASPTEPKPGTSVSSDRHPSVLLCDSEPQNIRALKSVLRAAGLSVCATQTAEEALTRASLDVPDLAIIELELVDSSGTEVCRRLREWSSMPLIVVSHVTDEERIVDAFAAGADDYVTKPVRPRELVARLEAHLRRVTTREEPVVVSGGVRVDLAAQTVRRDGREIRLTRTEYKLLSTLVHNRGRLLTHDALLRQAWGAAHAEDRQTLRTHIANLRRKLAAPSSNGPIRTFPGVGYLLEDEATRSATARPAPGSRSAGRHLLRVA
jgi:two-component system, OmpR family, KDP operon response regulator KdpE